MSWASAQARLLADGRLHLQHGPIDLLIGIEGPPNAIGAARDAASWRFATILGELTDELARLRRPLAGVAPPDMASPVARRMVAACWPHRGQFITPMAAVAGSVADEIAEAMLAAAPRLHSLYVNNGGDIAVYVAPDACLRIGVVADLRHAMPEGVVEVRHGSEIGGIATSGWRGRSFSRGIADAATVIARNAASADAAATIIANRVNVEDPAIRRAPAMSLDPDSDLGERLVTTDVGALPETLVEAALGAGAEAAERLFADRVILAAALALQGRWRIIRGADRLGR